MSRIFGIRFYFIRWSHGFWRTAQ